MFLISPSPSPSNSLTSGFIIKVIWIVLRKLGLSLLRLILC
ncbi:hypothetical protein LINPERPRIM_LOCUS25849 [Linum perenne]